MLGDSVSYINTFNDSRVSYTPERSQKTESAYGEVRFPIIGKDNHVPLIRELELQVAGRYDRYTGVGANTGIQCFPANSVNSFAGPLPPAAFNDPCPANGVQPAFATTRNGNFQPDPCSEMGAAPGSDPRADLVRQLSASLSERRDQERRPYKRRAGRPERRRDDHQRDRSGSVATRSSSTPFFFGLNLIPAKLGGNPDVDPRNRPAGRSAPIVTPRFVPGLRLSADWTRITIKNAYFQPFSLLGNGNIRSGQQAFNDFLAAHPERFTRPHRRRAIRSRWARSPSSTPPPPICRRPVRSDRFRRQLHHQPVRRAARHCGLSATWLRDLSVRPTKSAKVTNITGVVSNQFLAALARRAAWNGKATPPSSIRPIVGALAGDMRTSALTG